MRKVLYTVTIIVLLAVFAFSAFQVVTYFIDSKAQADQFAQLQDIKNNAATQNTEATQPTQQATASTARCGMVRRP